MSCVFNRRKVTKTKMCKMLSDEVLGFHGGENLVWGLVGCVAVQSYAWLPVLDETVSPVFMVHFYHKDKGKRSLTNVGTHLQDCLLLQPR
jgi:hypothetical protein